MSSPYDSPYDSPYYERLTAMDTSFLVLEKPWSPLHVSATLIYESGPMARPDGGIDIAAYRDATESVLHRIPRYRQKLQWIPVVGHPVWVDDPDPMSRVEKIRVVTEQLKASKQALDADLIMNIAEWTPTILLTLASRSASGSAPYNMMVTNVPGPQQELYLLGARLQALYSQVPIADSTALGVALVSYAGKLCWGFNADFESVPDLERFADAIESSFAEIADAAGVTFDGTESAAAYSV